MGHRIGSVPYLNARPLVYGLAENPEVDYSEDIPSRLATHLKDGRLDAALVSSIEASVEGAGPAVPGLGIASRGTVMSVKLIGSIDPRDAVSIALDGASLTAAALTRIVYRHFFNRPDTTFLPVKPSPDPRETDADATLVIGDAALQCSLENTRELDLGEIWTEYTNLPFVWALWLTSPDADLAQLSRILHDSYQSGIESVEQQARTEARSLGITPDVAVQYLTNVMIYQLDEDAREGLELFFKLARDYSNVKPPSQ